MAEFSDFVNGLDILFGNKFILFLFTAVFGYLTYRSYLEKNKNEKIYVFNGTVLESECVSNVSSSVTRKSRVSDRYSTTSYSNTTKCTVKLSYNSKFLTDNPEETEGEEENIVLTGLTNGPYVKGQVLKLQSIGGRREDITLCCSSPAQSFYVFLVLTIICSLFLVLYKSSDEDDE